MSVHHKRQYLVLRMFWVMDISRQISKVVSKAFKSCHAEFEKIKRKWVWEVGCGGEGGSFGDKLLSCHLYHCHCPVSVLIVRS